MSFRLFTIHYPPLCPSHFVAPIPVNLNHPCPSTYCIPARRNCHRNRFCGHTFAPRPGIAARWHTGTGPSDTPPRNIPPRPCHCDSPCSRHTFSPLARKCQPACCCRMLAAPLVLPRTGCRPLGTFDMLRGREREWGWMEDRNVVKV